MSLMERWLLRRSTVSKCALSMDRYRFVVQPDKNVASLSSVSRIFFSESMCMWFYVFFFRTVNETALIEFFQMFKCSLLLLWPCSSNSVKKWRLKAKACWCAETFMARACILPLRHAAAHCGDNHIRVKCSATSSWTRGPCCRLAPRKNVIMHHSACWNAIMHKERCCVGISMRE